MKSLTDFVNEKLIMALFKNDLYLINHILDILYEYDEVRNDLQECCNQIRTDYDYVDENCSSKEKFRQAIGKLVDKFLDKKIGMPLNNY